MKNSTIKPYSTRSLFTGLLLAFCVSWSIAQTPTIEIPDGFAGAEGTTGGGDASPVTVSTASEFKDAVMGDSPAVIVIDGMLNIENVSVGSNKTIVGNATSSGLYGGNVRLNGSNYIIQNLILGPNKNGSILQLSGAEKVFIHKCDLRDGVDGNLSIIKASDYITVSWCKFYFTDTTLSGNVMLIGNGDDIASDSLKFHVTVHHNWFADGCVSRMPRVRYGKVHLYNNYYSCQNNTNCIGTDNSCNIRCENLYFDNVETPWHNFGATYTGGELGWENLKFVNCEQPTYIANTYPVFEVPYSSGINNVDNVKNIVSISAGNVFKETVCYPATVSLTSPEDGEVFPEATNIVISADANDVDGRITKVEFFIDSTSLGYDSRKPYTLDWENPENGTYRITAEATDNHGNVTISSPVNITVGTHLYPCDSVITISAPFTQNGPGEYCWRTSDSNLFINSWLVDELDINGVVLKNQWYGFLPEKIDGYYYIHYVAQFPWSHFEIKPNHNGGFYSLKNSSDTDIANSAEAANHVICYPNPVNDILNIKLNNESNESIDVYLMDATGRIIKSDKINGNTHAVDLTALPSGVYLIKMTGSHCNMEQRIIKK